jgi:hypothetical protein
MLELACLMVEVHRRFYSCPLEVYLAAEGELSDMAWALGYTMNDLAKICTYAGD